MNNYKKYLINSLTLLRIIGIPFIFMIQNKYLLFIYCAILFITDFIDGFLARKWDLTSKLGAILDLIADKTLVIILLINYALLNKISWFFVFLVALREILSMVIRKIKLTNQNQLIGAKMMGKVKTTLQFIGIGMMILDIKGYNIVLYVMLVLSYLSFFDYVKEFLRKENNE